MSSLTSQESSANQPELPSNQGTTTHTGPGKDDPSVPFKVGNESSKGLNASTTDKVWHPRLFSISILDTLVQQIASERFRLS